MPSRLPLPLVQAPAQARAQVVLSEPMRRYRCNQKGCCCRGWEIPFKLDDVIRLFEHLDEKERSELGEGMRLLVDEAPVGAKEDLLLRSIKLKGVGDDEHCRFVEPSGGCRVHAQHGISALPDICVNFPAHGFRDEESNTVEMYWDPVCPEVVRMFTEAETPLSMSTIETAPAKGASTQAVLTQAPLEMGWHDEGFAQRVANSQEPLVARIGDAKLIRPELLHIREASLRAFDARARPVWESLAWVLAGFRDLEPGGALTFHAHAPDDLAAFQSYFGACIGAHSPALLFWSLKKMVRFVHAVELQPLVDAPKPLLAGLDAWGDSLDQRYDPHEATLRPLYSRWLQHRFGMLYVNQDGEVREAADTMALIFGAALRYAGGIAAALDRPVDSAIAQAGISCAEYFYRTMQFAGETLPWYASVDIRKLKAEKAAAGRAAATKNEGQQP